MEIGTAAASAGGELASKKVVRLLAADVQRRIDLRFYDRRAQWSLVMASK